MASEQNFNDWYFAFSKEFNRTPSQEEVWKAALATHMGAAAEPDLKAAVFTVLEGFTLPHDVRKFLETAYYAATPLALTSAPAELCPTCGASEPYTGTCGTSDSDTRALCKRATQPAAGAIDARGQEVEWGDPKTVGMFIRQLQTIAPETPIHAAFHTDYKGKRTAFIRGVCISRERVSGRFIRQGDESVPYSIVVWAQQDQLAALREEAPAAAGDAQAVALTSQQVYDRFSFLEGLVSEGTYRKIARAAIEIQRAALAAAPAPEADETAVQKARDEGFSAGTIAALAVVRNFDHEVCWHEILNAAGAETVTYHAAHVEPEDWEWAGFGYYKVKKPRKTALKAAQPIEREDGK